jgi:hypothetical protein
VVDLVRHLPDQEWRLDLDPTVTIRDRQPECQVLEPGRARFAWDVGVSESERFSVVNLG